MKTAGRDGREPSCHGLRFAVHGLFDVRVDRPRVARAIHATEAPRLLIEVDERTRVTLEGRDAVPGRLGVVVGAPDEPRLRVEVADLVVRGRLEVDVVNLAADRAVA